MTFFKRIVYVENVQEKTLSGGGRRVVGKRITKGMMGEAGDPGCVVSLMPREETVRKKEV